MFLGEGKDKIPSPPHLGRGTCRHTLDFEYITSGPAITNYRQYIFKIIFKTSGTQEIHTRVCVPPSPLHPTQCQVTGSDMITYYRQAHEKYLAFATKGRYNMWYRIYQAQQIKPSLDTGLCKCYIYMYIFNMYEVFISASDYIK